MMRTSTLRFRLPTVGALLGVTLLALDSLALRLSPVEFDVTISQGSAETLSFQVRNDESEALQMAVGLCDWIRDINGANLFCEEAGEVERSAADWVSVAPTQFELDPGGVQEVRFTLSVPDGSPLEGTYWTAVMVEATPKRTEEQPGTQIVVKRRFGVKIYATIAGTGSKDGQVSDLEHHGLNPLWVTFEFLNRGTLNLKEVTGWVEVRDVTGATLETIPVGPFPVLPGFKRRILAQSARPRGEVLPPGDYVILAVLDFGGDSLVGAQLVLRVAPLELRPIGEAENPPADLDGDGFYEDIDGDGTLNLEDANLLGAHLEEPTVQENWRAFDFTNDGHVDFNDVLALKDQIEGAQ